MGDTDWLHAFGPMGTFTNAVIQDGPDVLESVGREIIDAGDSITGGGKGAAPTPQLNPMNYQYGGQYGYADQMANQAIGTGNAGIQVGQYGINHGENVAQAGRDLALQRFGDAGRYDQRAALSANWAPQNMSLQQLGGLEAQQGPSAAQAQLQAGNNQAMAQQMAMARSGRGMGGNAAAMGQAQGNMAGIAANQANSAAALRAQEDAAWRQRQAANIGAVAGMQGQQSQADLSAALASRAQNDAMYGSMVGMGQDAYFQGADAGFRGYDQALQGTNISLQGQQLADQIRQNQMQGWQTGDDNLIRMWAAQNGYNLQQQAAQDQKTAGYINMVAGGLSTYAGAGRGGGTTPKAGG